MDGESCAVVNEFSELLDTAIYNEIASQAFYEASQEKTNDPGARALMAELAKEELKHVSWLKEVKEKGLPVKARKSKGTADLKISEYIVGGEKLEGAGLQETLVFALKNEQQSVDFYSRMQTALTDENAKRLCQRLIQEERKHKRKLEVLYDDLFYGED